MQYIQQLYAFSDYCDSSLYLEQLNDNDFIITAVSSNQEGLCSCIFPGSEPHSTQISSILTSSCRIDRMLFRPNASGGNDLLPIASYFSSLYLNSQCHSTRAVNQNYPHSPYQYATPDVVVVEDPTTIGNRGAGSI